MARSKKKTPSRRPVRPAAAPSPARASDGESGDFAIVGVGASAGGLEAFTELLRHLPAESGMGFVLVQHLDPTRESALTELLAKTTPLAVSEVKKDCRVRPNHVYVIPPNANLAIEKGVLRLRPREEGRSPHRSVDYFFESLAHDQRERAIGVILSGTATDGTLGLEAIKGEGGITFAQDKSAKYDSMPRNAAAAGCVDFVLSPEKIAQELARIAKHPYLREPLSLASAEEPAPAAIGKEPSDEAKPNGKLRGQTPDDARKSDPAGDGDAADRNEPPNEGVFQKILHLVRLRSGVDFSVYKSNTIRRRIQRRMILGKIATVDAYARLLRSSEAEVNALYADLLIGVTAFFRNPEAFAFLQRTVFPQILPERRDQPLRMWVLGCSTGQEAYSLAMAYSEYAERLPRSPKLQIFATDLNEAFLDRARGGLYASNLVADVSPERLRRFFVQEDGGYRVVKELREAIVFARQNLLSDPPFSRMDLISCRNLLIYIEPGLQTKIIPTFHYALRPKGCLFLGASETIGSFTDLFEPLDRKFKIYRRKGGPGPTLPARIMAAEPKSKEMKVPPSEETRGLPRELNAQREVDRITRNRYAPPSIVVNAELQITEFRGDTGPYLVPPTGQASFHVLKMAREGLMLPLRAALQRVRKSSKASRQENVRVVVGGKSRLVSFEVVPLKNVRDRSFLIFFEESATEGRSRPKSSARVPAAEERPLPAGQAQRRLRALEADLAETRDYAQSLQEQQDAALEELQASNEEVTSANEELQSINEELETSKEELESSNEELTTINEEMGARNAELSRLNGDLVNFQNSTRLGIIVLARDLTIRRFSAQAEKQFNLIAADIGRSIGGVRHTLEIADLDERISDVIARVRESEVETRDRHGRWYSLRIRPYLTVDNKVDGAVVVLVDITDLKRAETDVKAARDYAEATVRTARDPMVVLRGDLRVNTANEAFYRTFKVTPAQTEGQRVYELGNRQWDIPRLRELLEDILPRNSFFNDFEVTHTFPEIGRRIMLLNARRLDQAEGAPPLILLSIEDVTERHRASEVAAQLTAIVQSTDDAIIAQTIEGVVTSWSPGAERMFGYTAKEMIGQNLSRLVPPARSTEPEQLLDPLRRGERVSNFETERQRKDGSTVSVSISMAPLFDPRTGRVSMASVIARDITERRAAAERVRLSEIRLRRFFEAAQDGVLILDSASLRIADANPFASQLLGYPREELLGRELREIGLLTDEPSSDAAYRELRLHGIVRLEAAQVRTGTGDRRDLEIVIKRHPEDGLTLIHCNLRDITRRRQAEEALRRASPPGKG